MGREGQGGRGGYRDEEKVRNVAAVQSLRGQRESAAPALFPARRTRPPLSHRQTNAKSVCTRMQPDGQSCCTNTLGVQSDVKPIGHLTFYARPSIFSPSFWDSFFFFIEYRENKEATVTESFRDLHTSYNARLYHSNFVLVKYVRRISKIPWGSNQLQHFLNPL